ncbi:MAG: hypothetical protein NZM05_11135 [Chloroherpetonaceae bacterium]|nr:hypothetical protein [Chloroherpetonaceae bacterium]
MQRVKADLPLNYITIKTTQSRIDKGLLAIPASLSHLFPQNVRQVYLQDEHGKVEPKTFTPYRSSSRECRIGGLRSFYEKYKVKDGEELVIQILDDRKYRLIPERVFQATLRRKLNTFDKANDDEKSEAILRQISDVTNLSREEILRNKFVVMSKAAIEPRRVVPKRQARAKENIPLSIRKILLALYSGKCQVTGFTFLTKHGTPYFEVHHIDDTKGHHPKNLLVVSPNTHAQFTYANVTHYFDNEGWLRKVKFNENEFEVFQIIDTLQTDFEKEIHSAD